MPALPPYRCFLLPLGYRLPCAPVGLSTLTRSREEREGAFYARTVLNGPLQFEQEDFSLLLQLERSTDRCQAVGLLLEGLNATGKYTSLWQGQFRLSDCTFDLDSCQIEVTVAPQDGYQDLYERWERPYNLLACPAPRRTLTALLSDLPASDQFEFRRIDSSDLVDYTGNGWSVFLKATNWIKGGVGGGTRNRDVLLFRLARRGVAYQFDQELDEYAPADLSAAGYQLDEDWLPTEGTPTANSQADYVKTVGISGFQPYRVGTYGDWARLAPELVLANCGAASPGPGYVRVTGPDPTGANNAERGGQCLNLRRSVNDENFKSVWWRYGLFRFTRCLPLLTAAYYLLSRTVPALCPPDPAQLSSFFTQDQNQATGESGSLNELSRLYVSAGSDVKRPRSSESATRLMVSLKTFLTDIANGWDCGFFIDPATGFLRLEHRAYFERRDTPALDLTDASLRPTGTLRYHYEQTQLPRTEKLVVSSAQTSTSAVDFALGQIDYSGQCVTQTEGQSEQVRTVTRLTGDVRALVLSGDTLPDECLAVLVAAPGAGGEVQQGNQAVAASELLKRYHRRGRVLKEGTLLLGGFVQFDSVRPTLALEPITVDTCQGLDPYILTRPYTSRYAPGGQLWQATWSLYAGTVAVSLRYAPLPGQGPLGLPREYAPGHFNPTQFG